MESSYTQHMRPAPLLPGETYHIYNRGAHKQAIFTDAGDYQRFLYLLYLANHSDPIHLGNLFERYKTEGRSFMSIFSEPTDHTLVDILAYCLMPNHFHLVMRQKSDNGISRFMQKVGTAYTMYFNAKYDHGGTIFQGTFKSKHINSDPYFQWIFSYIHLNPIDLVESGWKERGITDFSRVYSFISSYDYSSHQEYVGRVRPQSSIVALESAPECLKGKHEIEELLRWNNIADEFNLAPLP